MTEKLFPPDSLLNAIKYFCFSQEKILCILLHFFYVSKQSTLVDPLPLLLPLPPSSVLSSHMTGKEGNEHSKRQEKKGKRKGEEGFL